MSAAEILALLAAFEGVLIVVLATYIWQERRQQRQISESLGRIWRDLETAIQQNEIQPEGEKT